MSNKPAVFIGSSTESLPVAYALQENLEHHAEVTVWTQGIFEPSKYTLPSLIDALEGFDFGVFVFAPDDMLTMRGKEQASVRDNVIFELGLFVGRLGQERNFIVVPRGQEGELHLPTDLLGLTGALYDAKRTDGNLCAALGPASNKITKALAKLGKIVPQPVLAAAPSGPVVPDYSDEDKFGILSSWMGKRSSRDNLSVIYFTAVDKELELPAGTAKQFIKAVAQRFHLIVVTEGEHTILFTNRQQPRTGGYL